MIGQIGPKIEELKRQVFNRQPNEQGESQLRTLEAELKSATSAFLEVIKDAETEFARPPDGQDKITNVREVADMQSALRELSAATNKKTVALYTLMWRNKYYLILLTPDGEIKAFGSVLI
jgi:hypothetical protein